MTEIRSKALVALGGNQESDAGSPHETLLAAVAALQKCALSIRKVSRLFATPCFPAGAGPDYVNAAMAVEFAGNARDLLAELHAIEARFHRTRDHRWGARTLDLDLIAVEDQVLPDLETYQIWRDLPAEQQTQVAPDRLILPHPRLQDRAFVLVPLADVAPDWRHPVSGETVLQMLSRLPEGDVQAVVPL